MPWCAVACHCMSREAHNFCWLMCFCWERLSLAAQTLADTMAWQAQQGSLSLMAGVPVACGDSHV